MRSQTSLAKSRDVSSLTSSVKCGFHRFRKWYHHLRQELKFKNQKVQRDPVEEVLEEFTKMLSYFEEEELQNMENENIENELRELAAKGDKID